MLRKIKQYFCNHKMKITKYYNKEYFYHHIFIDCYHKICSKCDYIDNSKCGYKWSKFYLDYCRERGMKYIVRLEWCFDEEPQDN